MSRWAWPAACLGALALSTLLALLSPAGGNAAFVAGAVVILVSIGFVGFGGSTRFRIVRGLFGDPVAVERQDPTKRAREISLGLKIFLVGVALWAPLAFLALR